MAASDQVFHDSVKQKHAVIAKLARRSAESFPKYHGHLYQGSYVLTHNSKKDLSADTLSNLQRANKRLYRQLVNTKK
jgi:recombinational DNA repair protein (RecF pathway)